MADVLDEVTGEISREAVSERIRDWEQRIVDLFSTIAGWLPQGWSSKLLQASVPMNEEMMRTAGVPATRLPALHLLREGTRRVTIEPRTLWIIGANGRLDVRTSDRNYFIVDRSQNFERPLWRLVDSRDRLNSIPMDRLALQSILG